MLSTSFHNFYTRYSPMVHRRCVQLLGNQADALDITQEVFAKLLAREVDLATIEDPGAYLWCSATRTCLNHIRATRRYDHHIGNSALHHIACYEEGPTLSARAFLATLFRSQSCSTRLLATLHYVDGMTLAETAQIAGLSVSGVRKRLRQLKLKAEQLQGASS
tara:strand:- start:61 stop:549 length:489 start_codon:yes stop_codon:yes gene_type:complete